MDVPESVREPSMKFLAQGRKQLEKWAIFQAHFLQRRIRTNPKEIDTTDGMLLMLKLLLVHINQPLPRAEVLGEPDKTPPNYAKDAIESVSDIRKYFVLPKREGKELRERVKKERSEK